MADDTKPPLPWRWEVCEDDLAPLSRTRYAALVAANGDVLIDSTLPRRKEEPHVDITSPYVRAVTEAAGELEAKLRDLTLRAGALLEQTYVDLGPVPTDDEDLVAILACEELLSRVDERAKGG